MNAIRFEFERILAARNNWVPGKVNMADPETKPETPLQQPFQFTMLDVRLEISFEGS